MADTTSSPTRTIGVHIGSPGNPFYSDFAHAALNLARARGYDLVIGHASPSGPDAVGGARSLEELGVSGLVTFSNMVEIENAAELRIPVVGIEEAPVNPDSGESPGPWVIEVDAYEGGRRVADHLIEMGRQRLAVVLHHLEQRTSRRGRGFFDRLVELDRAVEEQNVVTVPPTIAGGRAAAELLQPRLGQFDGAFCFNDAVAIGLMNGLVQAGTTVPYEVAVVGWDNISMAQLAFPQLSTVDIGIDRLASLAVDAIVARIEGVQPAAVKPLPVRLLVRASSDSGLAELRERHRLPLWRVGGIVHDFNNTLAVLMGTNELLRREVVAGSRAAGLIDRAEASLHRAEVLTGQLRSNLERRPGASLVDVDESLSGVLEDLRQVMGEVDRVELVRSDEQLVVLVDPGLLGSTLINLALNSRAVAPTGTVSILARRATAEEFLASFTTPAAETAAAYACIEFRDDGPGVPADVVNRIFEPYFSKTDGGVGLGLAIARSFMRDGGGNLCYDGSRPGACFVLYLPLVDPECRAEVAGIRPVAGARPPFCFAVIDDEPLVLKTVMDLLQARGHQAEGFVRAEEAIEAFQGGAKAYDLLLTDLHLPGMSGIGAAKAARFAVPDLPVAYMTGLADAFEGEIELNECTIVVEKPLNPADIDRIVELGRVSSIADRSRIDL